MNYGDELVVNKERIEYEDSKDFSLVKGINKEIILIEKY